MSGSANRLSRSAADSMERQGHGQFPQVLVQGFPADAEFAGQLRFLLARRDAPFQFGNLFTASMTSFGLGRLRCLASAIPSLPFHGSRPARTRRMPITDSIRFAIGESSPVKVRLLTNSMRTPRLVSLNEAAQVIRLRANRSMLCTTTVSPSRTKASSSQAQAAGCRCPTPCR